MIGTTNVTPGTNHHDFLGVECVNGTCQDVQCPKCSCPPTGSMGRNGKSSTIKRSRYGLGWMSYIEYGQNKSKYPSYLVVGQWRLARVKLPFDRRHQAVPDTCLHQQVVGLRGWVMDIAGEVLTTAIGRCSLIGKCRQRVAADSGRSSKGRCQTGKRHRKADSAWGQWVKQLP